MLGEHDQREKSTQVFTTRQRLFVEAWVNKGFESALKETGFDRIHALKLIKRDYILEYKRLFELGIQENDEISKLKRHLWDIVEDRALDAKVRADTIKTLAAIIDKHPSKVAEKGSEERFTPDLGKVRE